MLIDSWQLIPGTLIFSVFSRNRESSHLNRIFNVPLIKALGACIDIALNGGNDLLTFFLHICAPVDVSGHYLYHTLPSKLPQHVHVLTNQF